MLHFGWGCTQKDREGGRQNPTIITPFSYCDTNNCKNTRVFQSPVWGVVDNNIVWRKDYRPYQSLHTSNTLSHNPHDNYSCEIQTNFSMRMSLCKKWFWWPDLYRLQIKEWILFDRVARNYMEQELGRFLFVIVVQMPLLLISILVFLLFATELRMKESRQ